MIVFISGPLEKDDILETEANRYQAWEVAVELLMMGHVVLCPHIMSYGMDGLLDHDDWVERWKRVIERCDAVVALPRWRESPGATEEVSHAKKIGIPVFFWPNAPEACILSCRCGGSKSASLPPPSAN